MSLHGCNELWQWDPVLFKFISPLGTLKSFRKTQPGSPTERHTKRTYSFGGAACGVGPGHFPGLGTTQGVDRSRYIGVETRAGLIGIGLVGTITQVLCARITVVTQQLLGRQRTR